jgi:glycogen debranching enzyme
VIPRYDAQHNERSAYVLPERETPFGLTLGNFKTYASCTPKGGVRGLWDADSDRIVFGTHQLAYRLRDRDRSIMPQQIDREFTFLPYAQISEFALDERLRVRECFYVPHGPLHERTVSFVIDITCTNESAEPVDLAIFPWALLVGQRFYGEPESEVHATVDGGTIRAWNDETGAARIWGASRAPHAAAVALRERVLSQAIRRGTLRDESQMTEIVPELAEYASGRIFGTFEYRLNVAAGGAETLRIVVAFDGHGSDAARAKFDALLHDERALDDTERYYARALADARLMTPSPTISRGVVWAKANMLRIVKDYPHGWGSTNSPPSDILVSRDTSWFVHGFDYLMPQFSRDAIDVFNRFLADSGQVVEYVRGVNGFSTSYELNVNDDTPLHLVAILHHYNATRDRAWVAGLAPRVRKVADYLLSQRDANGLVYCEASGVDMYGITSWRNIIPYYTLDGAVTEINAEAVFALESAATLCEVAGDDDHARRYAHEARALREAMMAHLFNADTGDFALNYDKRGNYNDNFTADEVFPVLFNVANAEQRRAILARLGEADFATPVGLRTISTADSWYFPSHGFGLLGGVWPDLTLWFAVALARNGSVDASVAWLDAIYATMEEGTPRNTVPGQFAEWFDGGSLTNRGMYMSPWTSAKYLWAVAETVCGLDGYRASSGLCLAPAIPNGWAWTAVGRVRFGGGHATYVIDVAAKTIFGDVRDAEAEEPYRYVYAGTDVSHEAVVSPPEVGVVVFEEEAGTVRAFMCNMLDMSRDASLELRGRTTHVTLAAGELREVR